MKRALVIDRDGLERLLGLLAKDGYRPIALRRGEGAVVMGEVRSVDEMATGLVDEQSGGRYRLHPDPEGRLFGITHGQHSFRSFFQKPERRVARIERRGRALRILPEPFASERHALIGVRACDLAGIGVLDHVLAGQAVKDGAYVAARSPTLVVGASCTRSSSTCFCTHMRTGPRARPGETCDVALTEVAPGQLLAEADEERGAALLDRLGGRPATDDDLRAAERAVDGARADQAAHPAPAFTPEEARDVLTATQEAPPWDDVAQRCLACANCTLVCPTCFCSDQHDRPLIASAIETAPSGDGDDDETPVFSVERVQHWDSCFTADHSRMHGHPVRASIRTRYRQWLTHKLSTWWEQFDESGCTGCGRCITWCPVGIDLREEVDAHRRWLATHLIAAGPMSAASAHHDEPGGSDVTAR